MSAPISRDLEALRRAVAGWRRDGLRLVTTNGCFDILHAGHLRTLRGARELGDLLVVGLNSDTSVRALKGDDRPVVGEAQRAGTLAELPFVDWVQVFAEPTPDAVLEAVRPDVHAKGGDYAADRLPEYELITSLGGRVEILPEIAGTHTSGLLAAYRARRD
jgi:rfaE bifunctional protein nucleotidyltransferase chain/domain